MTRVLKKFLFYQVKNLLLHLELRIFFKKIIKDKDIKFFYKESEIPVLDELIKIIKEIRNFKPDLLLAVGGGTVIDYAKIANVIDLRDDLAKLIVSYSYPFKKNIQILW